MQEVACKRKVVRFAAQAGHGVLIVLAGVLVVRPISSAQVTELVSIDRSGIQGGGGSGLLTICTKKVSTDGRYVVFTSGSPNLVVGDSPNAWDVFLRDRITQTTELVSQSSSGMAGNGHSGLNGLAMTPDARYVVFESDSNNLVPGDLNGKWDIFLRDRGAGTTELISISTSGAQGDQVVDDCDISEDGRLVVFTSAASNLVPNDTNGVADVFLRDRQLGVTRRVSESTAGVEGNDGSVKPTISADGRYVAFASFATNLVQGDTNNSPDVFVRDLVGGVTERITAGGTQPNSWCAFPAISGNGRYISFTSSASNLVPGDTNLAWDVFLYERVHGTIQRISVAAGGQQSNGDSRGGAAPSDDGRFVAFDSFATNLVSGETGHENVFVRDLQYATTEILSPSQSPHPRARSNAPSISRDGRFVVFQSTRRDLVQIATSGTGDVFLYDRVPSGFEGYCDPGRRGVLACPCQNPPGAGKRGCDNSAGTGGAMLSAAGVAYLSNDSLVFSTTGEVDATLGTLFESASLAASGVSFGQGVRCVGGPVVRLYTKLSTGGSISVPGPGEPSVSAVSASRGVQLQAGRPYYYFVAYRDPVILGGCPAGTTFNATQSGAIVWFP